MSDLKPFISNVLPAWDDAMDRFFDKCESARERFGLDENDVRSALNKGYGYEVGDQWADWFEEWSA